MVDGDHVGFWGFHGDLTEPAAGGHNWRMVEDRVVRDKHTKPVDPASVADDWRRRGYSCQTFVDPPGQAWRDFVHRTDELVTVIDGTIELTVDGIATALSPGDEAFIPRQACHDVVNIHDGVSRWLFGYN